MSLSLLFKKILILVSLLSLCIVDALQINMGGDALQGDMVQPRQVLILGGYSTRDCTDAGVLAAAQFALHRYFSEHLKETLPSDITFKVHKAEVQVGAWIIIIIM